MTAWTRVTPLDVAHLFKREAFAVRSAGVSPALLICAAAFVAPGFSPAAFVFRRVRHARGRPVGHRSAKVLGKDAGLKPGATGKEGSCCSW